MATGSTSFTASGFDLPQSRPLSGPEQRVVRLCLSTLGGLSAASMLGVAASLYLVNAYPLLLIALSPLGRHLVLIAPVVDPVTFVALAVGRRMVFYLPCFQLGRTLGPTAIRWIEARAARFGRFVRWLEKLFGRASHTVTFAMAGPTVSTLAGIAGMRAGVFFALASLGLVLRMLLLLYFAEWLRTPIEAVRVWIYEYWVPGTLLIVAGIALQRWWRRGTASEAPGEIRA